MTIRKVIPIIGTVGVPARYGGFETLAEQLCRNLPASETEFLIYCERAAYDDGERSPEFLGHRRKFLPIRANGIASLFHDALALIDAVFRRRAREIFIFGYSGAWILPLLKLLRPSTRFIVNVDGMEWRRDKFSTPGRLLLKLLEFCAARCASVIIADNAALAELFRNRYRREPVTIAYGGDHTLVDTIAVPRKSGHYLAIARIEPENNSEMILQACRNGDVPLVFIGNWQANEYGRLLREKFRSAHCLLLLDPIYSQEELALWRTGAIGYIHGHSVGGTNPSLVEALFHTDRLLSFDCDFNRATLAGSGRYFGDAAALTELLQDPPEAISTEIIASLRDRYRWETIAAQYRALLVS